MRKKILMWLLIRQSKPNKYGYVKRIDPRFYLTEPKWRDLL